MARFLLSEVYDVTGIGIVLVGKVAGGSLKAGMSAQISGLEILIKTIEMNKKNIREARSGDGVGLFVLVHGSIPVPEEKKGFFQALFKPGSSNKGILSKLKGKEIVFN